MSNDARQVIILSCLAAHEFAAGWRIEIEVVHLDHRALVQRSRLGGDQQRAFGGDTPGVAFVRDAADDAGTRYRGDTGKRFTAKTEAGDAFWSAGVSVISWPKARAAPP